MSRNNMSSISKQLSSINCASRKSHCYFTDIRLVLTGKTGSGKSSTASSILGHKVFDMKTSSSSVTQHCRRAIGEFRGRHLTLLETPGLLDTNQTPQEVMRELRMSVSLLSPGPHVFLLVIQIGRFTQEEKEAVKQIKQALGFHALSFTIVIFTHGDLLEDPTFVKHCLLDQCKDLAELVAECGGRYCVFNNLMPKCKEQVSKLLALVDDMMHDNAGRYYTSAMLKKAEDDLDQELQQKKKQLKEKEELIRKKQEAEIQEWYERELKMVQQNSKKEMEERMLELEKQNEEKLERDREEVFRQETEKSDRKEKEMKIQERLKIMEIRREEEEKRETLRKKLDKVTKMLEEQIDHEEKMRREMEKKMQKYSVENEKKEREREVQQIEKEQAIRQREEMKEELDKITHSLKEQSKKAEEWKKQMEDMLKHNREENQREKETLVENLRTEKRINEALTQKLKICTLQKHHDKECPEFKKSTKKQSTVTTVVGYAQEMGLVGLNAALETVGAPCCIQ